MSQDTPRLKAEIVHCLFLDLVGYSRGSMEHQRQMVQELRDIVRAAPEFRRAEADGELLRLDLGDGIALVFFRDPTAPARCAVEIARALGDVPHLKLRMGIHSGPVMRSTDITEHENVYGGGINTAQRVMDCGDAGHILLSQRSADDLRQFEEWAPHLHDLGEIAVKHDEQIRLYSLCTGEIGNPALPQKLRAAAAARRPSVTLSQQEPEEPADLLEPVGGAVPLDSKFYVVRPADDAFVSAIRRRDSIVLVKGARQMGKTSLLARGLQRAREAGARVVFTDFQTLNTRHLASADALLLTLAAAIAGRLRLGVSPHDAWDPDLGANMNMDWFLETGILGAFSEPLVWGLDEVDRLFGCAFGSEIFGLFRSWHNRRALEPDGPWSRLTLAISYSTEPHLFITDLNQSPFNIGTRLRLEDFTPEQTAELNRRYGGPLRNADEEARFTDLVNGHPYLTRRGLDEMVARGLDIGGLEAQADRDEGLFGDHLRRLLASLSKDPDLREVMRGVLRGHPCPDVESFYRLWSAGALVGDSAANARPRCRLYATYLARHLL